MKIDPLFQQGTDVWNDVVYTGNKRMNCTVRHWRENR